jgi:hypothetical protein
MRYNSIHDRVPGGLHILAVRPSEKGEIQMGGLGQIKILAERKVKMVEIDIEVDEDTKAKICHAALCEITSDADALFSYGFTQALKRLVQTKGKKCTKKSSNKKSSRR